MGTIERLQALLAEGKDGALLRYGLGSEYLKHGDFDHAAEHLQKAVALDPRYSAAWKLLGKALASAGRESGAIAAYENGIRVAEERRDIQAAKEMRVFLRRLRRGHGAA